MNGIYAHPLIGMFRANNNDPAIAPQKEICSISVFMINSNMKLREVIQNHMVTHMLQLCKHELEHTQLNLINLGTGISHLKMNVAHSPEHETTTSLMHFPI